MAYLTVDPLKINTERPVLNDETEIARPAKPWRKSTIVTSVVGGILILGWFYAAPYFTFQHIIEAAKEGDTDELADLVDFPSVRESMKEQIRAAMVQKMGNTAEGGGAFAMLGMALANMMIDPMVDSIVSPSGIAAITAGQKPPIKSPALMSGEASDAKAQIKERKEDTKVPEPGPDPPSPEMRYEGFSKYVVRFRGPSGQEHMALVLRRYGLSWKLASIRMTSLLHSP